MYVVAIPNRNSPPAILLRESYRDGARVKNRTLANLSDWAPARVDALRQVLRGQPVSAGRLDGAFTIVRSRPHGHVAAVVGTCRRIALDGLLAPRPARRRPLVLAMVVARLLDPRSKLATARGLDPETLTSTLGEVLGLGRADEDDLYAAMDWLLPQQGRIEQALARRHLTEGSLVLYDVTSTYFEGSTAEWGRLGYSRDGRPDCRQVVVGLVLADGLPIGHHVLRGDRRDETTLPVAIADIERRFRLGRVIVVADRGLLSAANIARLRARGLEDILACRLRRSRETRVALRRRPAATPAGTALQVWAAPAPDGSRLVGFRNPERAAYDRDRRADILAAIRADLDTLQAALARARALGRGPTDAAERDARVARLAEVLATRQRLGKRYFAAQVTPTGRLQYTVKQRVLRYEAQLDGTTILTTNNTTLSDAEVVARYKELTRIEASFRDLKSLLDLRPVYHRRARRIAAHVFVCVLALLVEEVLERKLRAAGLAGVTAAAALRELKRLRVLRDTVNGVEITRVSAVSALQKQILTAVGVPVPSPLVWAERVPAAGAKVRRAPGR